MALCLTIASDTAPEAIEVEVHSDHEKQNSDEETVTVDVDVDVGESGESGEVHDLDKENEMNGGNVEKRSNGVVASAGDDWDAKRQRTGTDAEDAEAVGGEVRVIGDEKAVDGEDAEAVADAVAVDGEGRENSCGLLDLGIEAAIAECKIGMQSSTSAGSFLQDAPQLRSLGPLALPLIGIVLYFVINEAAPILDLWLLFFEAQSSNFSICQGAFRHYRTTPCASTRTLGL